MAQVAQLVALQLAQELPPTEEVIPLSFTETQQNLDSTRLESCLQ
jgi:hypothetical protein